MKGALIISALIIVAIIILRMFTSGTAAQEEKQLGADFLANNAQEPGVKTTASGLQYLGLNVGQGTQHPTASDNVTVHYHGTLLNGIVFDSSVKRGEPLSFALNRVIKGWTEGVQLMVVGEKTRFFIPSDLAYGNSSMGKIKGGSTLVFEVELLGINE